MVEPPLVEAFPRGFPFRAGDLGSGQRRAYAAQLERRAIRLSGSIYERGDIISPTLACTSVAAAPRHSHACVNDDRGGALWLPRSGHPPLRWVLGGADHEVDGQHSSAHHRVVAWPVDPVSA